MAGHGSGSPSTVVVVDDYPLFVEALAQRLADDHRFSLVGVATDGRAAVELCAERRPAVALIGWFLPDMRGVDLLQRVMAASQATGVVALAGVVDPSAVHSAVALGARGYLVKQETGLAILDGLHRVGAGGSVFSPAAEACLMAAVRARAEEAGALPSARESEILRFLAGGATSREVAERLFLSEATVKTHLNRLYRKLGVSDRSAAVAEAMRRDWVS